MAERSNAAVLKTVDCNRSGGSNPSFSAENETPSRYWGFRRFKAHPKVFEPGIFTIHTPVKPRKHLRIYLFCNYSSTKSEIIRHTFVSLPVSLFIQKTVFFHFANKTLTSIVNLNTRSPFLNTFRNTFFLNFAYIIKI